MENSKELKSRPASQPARNGKLIAGLEHLSHLGKVEVDLECHLVSNAKETDCQFWLGVFKKGSLSPSEVLSKETAEQSLAATGEKGIDSDEAILFSDCESGKTNYILLVPEISFTAQNIKTWLEKVFMSIDSIKPSIMGLYLPDSVFKIEDYKTLVKEFIAYARKENSEHQKINRIYLHTAGHKYSDILNTSFEVKKHIGEEGIKVRVYH